MGCHPGPSMTISAMPSSNLSESALVGIYEVSKLLASPNRLERTLAGVLALLSSFLDMRHGLFALLDKQGEPEIVVGSGWSETNAKKFFDHLPERAVGQIFATKMPLVDRKCADIAFVRRLGSLGLGSNGRPAVFTGRRADQGRRRPWSAR